MAVLTWPSYKQKHCIEGSDRTRVLSGTEARTAISSTTTATQPSSASNAWNIKQLVIFILYDVLNYGVERAWSLTATLETTKLALMIR
eukprot:scaffold13403_cov40-Cyclotella_meneghiniana.AAC.2